MQDWHTKLGYDSCWSPAGANGIREENCIADPRTRVRIVEVILGDTRQAQALGYSVNRHLGRLMLDEEQAALAQAAGIDPKLTWMSPKQVKAAQRRSMCKACLLVWLLNILIDYLAADDAVGSFAD